MDDEDKESLRGYGKQLMATELRDMYLERLTGECVEEAAAVWRCELLLKHGPPPGMEPAVEAAERAWFSGALPPWAAHGTEAHIVSDIICEKSLSDEPRWPVSKINPVPPGRTANKMRIL
jgi:hypothetical protein